LEGDDNVRQCLRNAHLRRLLQEIDTAPDPETALKQAMNVPIFVEFADACLNVCGVQAEREPP